MYKTLYPYVGYGLIIIDPASVTGVFLFIRIEIKFFGWGVSNNQVWIIQKLVWGCRLKTKVSFKAIRGRAGVSSLLRRKGLYADIGGGEVIGRGRIGDRERGKGIRGGEEGKEEFGRIGEGVLGGGGREEEESESESLSASAW